MKFKHLIISLKSAYIRTPANVYIKCQNGENFDLTEIFHAMIVGARQATCTAVFRVWYKKNGAKKKNIQ